MADLADYQIDIAGPMGTATLGPGTSYSIQSVDGLGPPPVRDSDVLRPNAHGAFLGRDLLPSRTIALVANIVAAGNPAAVSAAMDALAAAWQVNSDGLSPLRYKLPGQNQRRIQGRPRRLAFDTTQLIYGKAKVTLEYVAADPRLYDDALQDAAMGLPLQLGTGFPIAFPLSFGGPSSSGTADAVNGGTFPTYPLILFHGPATNPSLENLSTGAHMSFVLVLGAGEWLTIDPAARTVMLDDTASRYGSLTPDSTWMQLQPGDNVMHFTAATYDPAASASLTWRSAHV